MKKPALNPKNRTLKLLARAAQKEDKPSPSEYQIHAAFIDYVKWKHPALASLLIHIPNEGKRSLAEGARQKRLGLTAGVPDLFFAKPKYMPIATLHGLWIEMKSPNGIVSQAQQKMIHQLRDEDYWVVVCYSVDEAIESFEWYVDHTTNLFHHETKHRGYCAK